ncbi:hypothetical protein GCM10029992_05750 [Glycomyces albus]
MLRFLFQADDLASDVELRDAERLRIRHARQQDLRVGPLDPELIDQSCDPTDDEVVAEVHDEVVVGEEIAGDEHRVREPERLVLPDVGDFDAQIGTVAYGLLISSAVSPTMIPTSLMPASAMASSP